MKKVLVISREYYPVSNGSTTCLDHILTHFSSETIIDIVCFNSTLNNKNSEIRGNQRIFSFANWSDKLLIRRVKGLNAIRIKNKIQFKFYYLMSKLIYSPVYLISNKIGFYSLTAWKNNLLKGIQKSLNIEEYDGVICMGAPFENIEATFKIREKYPDINIYIYQLDLYTYNPIKLIEESEGEETRLETEKEWYKNAEKIFVTLEMYEALKETELFNYNSKIVPLGMPVFYDIRSKQESQLFNPNKINVVYTGMFYKDIRSPIFLLKLFSEIVKKHPEVCLHLLGSGCEDMIEEYKPMFGSNLIVYGQKSKQYTVDALCSAHILVNVSNSTTTQAPSKILEYISTGKPIINVHSIDNDVCNKYLEQYEMSMSIKEQETSEHLIDNVYKFIEASKNIEIKYEELEKLYKEFLPANVAKKMENHIKDK